MTSKTKITLAAALFAALATPTLAAQDEWIVDSGRYVNGQVPSYSPSYDTRAPQLAERRNAAVIQNQASVAAPIVLDRATALGN